MVTIIESFFSIEIYEQLLVVLGVMISIVSLMGVVTSLLRRQEMKELNARMESMRFPGSYLKSTQLFEEIKDIENKENSHLIESLKKDIISNEEYISKIESDLDSIGTENILLNKRYRYLNSSKERLLDDSSRISLHSWMSLSVGGVFAVFGIVVLLQVSSIQQKAESFHLIDFWKLGPGLAINLIAFFFFRIYLATQSEIRQNQNEVTNIDMKLEALTLLRDEECESQIKEKVILELLKAERNRFVKKGERVVSESGYLDRNELREMFNINNNPDPKNKYE